MRYIVFVLVIFLASCVRDIPVEPILGDWYNVTGSVRWIFADTGTVCRQESGSLYQCSIYWYRDFNNLYLIEGSKKHEIIWLSNTSIQVTEDALLNPETFKLYRK